MEDSFALRPENFQPSGHCDFSKIYRNIIQIDTMNNLLYWYYMSENPNTLLNYYKFPPTKFTYDYKNIQTRCMKYKEKLMQVMYHPRNLDKLKDWRVNELY